MKIVELVTLAENKLMVLNGAMANAVQHGDTAEISRLEAVILETQETLDTLRGIAE
jgi:hypothetical protein